MNNQPLDLTSAFAELDQLESEDVSMENPQVGSTNDLVFSDEDFETAENIPHVPKWFNPKDQLPDTILGMKVDPDGWTGKLATENYETSRVSSPQMSPRDRWRAAVNDALIQIEIEPSSSWFSSDTISTGGIGQSSSVIRQDSNVGGSSGNPTIKRPTNTPQPQGAVSDSVLFLRALPVETRNRVRSGELAARPGNVDGEFVVYDPKYPNSVVQRVNIR